MFTGLIEEVGRVLSLDSRDAGARLTVAGPVISSDARAGDSIAVNGCCLTVIGTPADDTLSFDLLSETLTRTNLGALRPGSAVNLERALAGDGRLGGHFVQGHVDCAARIVAFDRHGADHRLEVELPAAFAQYVAYKGSIALDGISLTVAEVRRESLVVWVIPHTKRCTTLQSAAAGDALNVEFDLLAKYVARILEVRAPVA